MSEEQQENMEVSEIVLKSYTDNKGVQKTDIKVRACWQKGTETEALTWVKTTYEALKQKYDQQGY